MPAPAAQGSQEVILLTPTERERLVPSLSTREQLEEIERASIHAARVWAMRCAVAAPEAVLTELFSRQVHRRMFGGIWRGAGKYRTTAEGAGWEPVKIPEGMRMILDDAEGWIRFSTHPVHEVAVRLHHRIRCVRPWADGNGNHARLLADLVVASLGEKPLTWGIRTHGQDAKKARSLYREASRAADAGDMAVLVEFARS